MNDAHSIQICGPQQNRSDLCDRILRSLPDWFGIEEAIVEYVAAVKEMPTFVATHNGEEVGFLSIKKHFLECAEAYVLGVLPRFHRSGAGRAMFAAAERWLIDEGVRFFQVKTLAPTANYEPYERTRKFYAAIGFTPLEVFPKLWSERNPCLVMIKHLG